jgi:hypothetical protein
VTSASVLYAFITVFTEIMKKGTPISISEILKSAIANTARKEFGKLDENNA